MKKSYTIALISILSLSVLSGCSTPKKRVIVPQTPPVTESQATEKQESLASINISNFAFDPPFLTITKGTKVTWTNNDTAPHSIIGLDFSSASLANRESFTHTFNEVGTYYYTCGIHPTMKGEVIVK